MCFDMVVTLWPFYYMVILLMRFSKLTPHNSPVRSIFYGQNVECMLWDWSLISRVSCQKGPICLSIYVTPFSLFCYMQYLILEHFRHGLRWKLSFWQLSVQLVTKMLSKWCLHIIVLPQGSRLVPVISSVNRVFAFVIHFWSLLL